MDAQLRTNLKAIFRQYDQDGDGTISPGELKAVLLAISGASGETGLSDKEVDMVFKGMDRNKDDRIQFDEFVDWLTNDQAEFTDLCSAEEPTAKDKKMGKTRSALRKGLPEGVRAALKDEVAIADLEDMHLVLTGKEPDFMDVTTRLRNLDAKALRKAYEEADLDNNGYLQLEELRRLLFPGEVGAGSGEESMGIAKLFAQMDKNNDGKVRCGEFVSFMLTTKTCFSTVPSNADKKQIAAAFAKADFRKRGHLTCTDFQSVLGSSTDEERAMVKKAFDAVDANGDGSLSIVEFSRIYGKELIQASKAPEVTWTEVEDDDSDD